MLHRVISSEKVPFTYRVAGLGVRFLAWLIDLGIIVVLFAMVLGLGAALDVRREGLGAGMALVATFFVQWGYFALFEWLWHGQTPGKQALGIRVIRAQGTAVTFTEAAVRNVLRVVDGLPLLIPDLVPVAYGVGFLTAACDRENRRLGDLAAGTLVVYAEDPPRPIHMLHAAGAEALEARATLARPRLEALQRAQKQAILDLCLRRDQLRLRERARLFRAVADYFKARLDLAPQQYESDEKFVLEMAAVLTAERRGPAAVRAKVS